MGLEVLTVMHSEKTPADAAKQREELVRRVGSSVTFEKSPRLRAFFLHVCRCARENKSEEATEPQIAIYVYGRQPGYNPNEDNIVRSQARVLRMKLEHHFANEGKHEPLIITIPKGQYLPVFETRSKEAQIEAPQPRPRILPPEDRKPYRFAKVLIGGAALCVLAVIWFGYLWFESRRTPSPSSVVPAASVSQPTQNQAEPQMSSQRVPLASGVGETRIAAGHTGNSYVDLWGRSWESDRYYEGGVSQVRTLAPLPPSGRQGSLQFRSARPFRMTKWCRSRSVASVTTSLSLPASTN